MSRISTTTLFICLLMMPLTGYGATLSFESLSQPGSSDFGIQFLPAGTTTTHVDRFYFSDPYMAVYGDDSVNRTINSSGVLQTSLFSYFANSTLTMERFDGAPFTVTSIDLAPYWNVQTGTADITIIGTKSTGEKLFQNFVIDNGLATDRPLLQTRVFDPSFTNLVALEFVQGVAGGLDGDAYQFNNIVVSAVPIPAAAWLFSVALGVVGYVGKRKTAAR